MNAPTTTLPSQFPQHYSSYTFTACRRIHARAISQPYFTHDSTRLTFLTENGVKGLTIHDPGASNLDLVNLLPGNFFGRFMCMSYNFGAVIDFWPIIIILQYAWPEGYPCSVVSRNTITRREMLGGDATLLIDLSSGRVVIYGSSHGIQYILDPSSII